MNRVQFFSLFLAASGVLTAPLAHGADLTVSVSNLSAKKGMLRAAVYVSEKGFPDNDEAAHARQEAVVAGEEGTLVFKDLKPGKYAVAAMQDLNGNNKVDYNFVGYPKEPYGVSNNNVPTFSSPKYDEAVFTVGSDDLSISIKMRQP